MSEKIAIKEVQGLEQESGLVVLFELALNNEGTSRLYFVRGLDSDLGSVQMYDHDTNSQLNTYTALPVNVEGFDHVSTGTSPRPVITFANVLSTFGDALGSLTPNDLIGKKLYRRRTLRKYLKDGSADTGSGNTPVEFPRQVYVIDRIESENATEISFELTSPFNVEGLVLPYRVVGHNACPWQYQGASPTRTTANQRGACIWHEEGKYNINGTIYNVYVNEDDEYLVPSTTSFTTFSSSATKDQYYKTTTTLGVASGVRRYDADGTVDSGADGSTVNNYWQAVRNTSATPSDSSGDWQRIRIFADYSSSTNYFAYTDDRHNSYVKATTGTAFIWQATRTQETGSNTAPGFNEYWKRGDLCGKRLSSCQCRFGFNPINVGTASSTGKTAKDTEKTLPFGGFPGARKFK